MESLPAGIYGIISVIIAAVLTVCLGPWLREHFELRRIYLAPFRKWCSELYGELSEFKDRYICRSNADTRAVHDSLGRTLVIIDYRELHDRLREAPIYMGKIRKEEAGVAKYLQELMELVDRLWHSNQLIGLQDGFETNFDQSEHDVWYDAILKFPRKDAIVCEIRDSDISQQLWDKFREKFPTVELKEKSKFWKKQKNTIEKQRIDEALRYLRKQIP